MATKVTSEPSGSTSGQELRKVAPRSSHGEWNAPADRPDPVELITSQNESRLQFLVPIRHWRMSQSPFAFYRGGAKVMAHDLATTPSTGVHVQICGDAHLSNFGVFGSPERDLVFDLNDFDETLPGPWEWDVKRLAASFAIAARHNEYDAKDERDLPRRVAATYREAMHQFAEARYIDVWYAQLDFGDIYEAFADQLTKKQRQRGDRFIRKARSKDSLHAFDKLAEQTDDGYRITSQPPLIIPLREVPRRAGPKKIAALLRAEFGAYLDSVPDHIGVLLRRYRYRDMAIKVVGVGSVGTRCFIVLTKGRDDDDPFFLQIKEAGRSVLEDHLPESAYTEHGRRVVEGQRLMQATSDSFLGWHVDSVGKHYYWRQFKDMKGSVEVEDASLKPMRRYALLCGWTLARAHACSGDPAMIAGYLGAGDNFDRAIADFAVAYADQNERDYAAFTEAIREGRILAHE
jgi:uncharacterized protein (DUF2252 family)